MILALFEGSQMILVLFEDLARSETVDYPTATAIRVC